jgi:beta-glucosidase-like glycosyl hydrolase
VTSEEHNALARKISAEATVLLKNDNGFLPIKRTAKKIVVIGNEAQNPIVHGGGSGQVAPSYVVSPYVGILNYLGIGAGPSPPNNCSDGHFEVGIDYHNTDDQTSGMADSIQDCCKMCADRTDCNYFSYTGTSLLIVHHTVVHLFGIRRKGAE